ncbi:MAG TPA: 3-dehydroquinate synthase [Methylomirabilota bacterium]|jgi:3-dehydroquinate synthase|nr:3-dehydroquinate synthase [Methylomirabilota bacterium]
MSVHLQKITVPYEYPVYFTTDVFSPRNPDLAEAISRKEPTRRHRLLVLVEQAVDAAWPGLADAVAGYVEHHRERLELAAPPVVVEGGEACKNDPGAVARLQERLHALALDRQSFVVIVGGGALLDMAGYVAATVHRGVRVVRVPTTVLAQNDSGVGVKNGINMFGKKNFLGSFAPPWAVVNDSRFLLTLGRRDTVAGMAEAVKVALIRSAPFLTWLREQATALAGGDQEALAHLIQRCAQLHLEHLATSGDPFEFGSARPLDFGHWAAHKLESLSGNRVRHGEAVAIGIALDTLYSAAVGLLEATAPETVLELLETLGFRLWDPALELAEGGRPMVLDGLGEFREHLGGELTITLLRDLGQGVEVHEMSDELVLASLRTLRLRDRGLSETGS